MRVGAWAAGVKAERVVQRDLLHRRAARVVLVDARGPHEDDARSTWRAVARIATIVRRRMTPTFARERPPSSLLKPSLRWCCRAHLSW